MPQKFMNLKTEKQDLIIKIAMKEFTKNGYENASTNKIAENSKISKGSLFFYFGSKKKLYTYLFEFCLEKYAKDFHNEIDFSEKDLFKRLRKSVILKTKLMCEYPDVFRFITAAYLDNSKEIKDDIALISSNHLEYLTPIAKEFDVSLFRDDLDVENTVKTIMWSIDGLSREMTEKIRRTGTVDHDFSDEKAKTDDYIDFLEKTFYK